MSEENKLKHIIRASPLWPQHTYSSDQCPLHWPVPGLAGTDIIDERNAPHLSLSLYLTQS